MRFPVEYPNIQYLDILGGYGGLMDISKNEPYFSNSSKNAVINIYDNAQSFSRCPQNVIRTTPNTLEPYGNTNYTNGNRMRVQYSIVERNNSYMNAWKCSWSHANISGDNELSHAIRIRPNSDSRYVQQKVFDNFPVHQTDKLVIKFKIRAYTLTNVGNIWIRLLFGQNYSETGRLFSIQDTTGTDWTNNYSNEWRTLSYEYDFSSSLSNYEKFMFPTGNEDRARIFIQFKKSVNGSAWTGNFEIADLEVYIKNSDGNIKHIIENKINERTAKLFMFDAYHPSAIFDSGLMDADCIRLNHFYEALSVDRMSDVLSMINVDLTGNVINSPKISLFYEPFSYYDTGTIESLQPEYYLYARVPAINTYIIASIDNGNRCKVDLNNSDVRKMALDRLTEKILSCGVLPKYIFFDNAFFQGTRPSIYLGNNIDQTKYYRYNGVSYTEVSIDEYYEMMYNFIIYLKEGLKENSVYGQEFQNIIFVPNAGTRGGAYEHPNAPIVDGDKNFATSFYNIAGGFLTENTPCRFELVDTSAYKEPIIHPYNDNADWNAFIPITTSQMFDGRSLSHFIKSHKRNLHTFMICGIPIESINPLYMAYGSTQDTSYSSNSPEFAMKYQNAYKAQKLMLACYYLTMNDNSFIGIADNYDDNGEYFNKPEYALDIGIPNGNYSVLEPTDYGMLDGNGGIIYRNFTKNNILSGLVLLNPLGSFWGQSGTNYWDGLWYRDVAKTTLSETLTYTLPVGIWQDINGSIYTSTSTSPYVLTLYPKDSYILKNMTSSSDGSGDGSSNVESISKISFFNNFIIDMFQNCIRGLPFEFNFGYRNLLLPNNYPSWTKVSKKDELQFNIDQLLSSIYVYFNGENRGRTEEYSTIGSVGVLYRYKIDILLPVSNTWNSEHVFWDRIDKLIRKITSWDYKAWNSIFPDSILIEPMTASFDEPYLEFSNRLCHYASYEIKIIYSHKYGMRIRT